MNVDLMPINKLVEESEEYTTRAIGDSYLTLEEVERIGKSLLDGTEVIRLFPTEEERGKWKIISGTYEKLWRRREENNHLVEDLFKKLS